MSLEVSFSSDFASCRLEFFKVLVSNFEARVFQSRKVSNLPLYTPTREDWG